LTEQFVERYRLPDGSVYPRHAAHAAMASPDPHAGHAMPAEPDAHASHGASTAHASAPTDEHAGHGGNDMPVNKDQPIDVLVTAGRWYYLPDKLRLDAGQAYRFKMMAVDIAHGASIQLGQGGRMMRLQPGRITEAALTFHQPGRYLMLCTVYCGEAHQLMQATIEVV
jgi:heme/copper-type cytochrome/quinol oxidase subunit 2